MLKTGVFTRVMARFKGISTFKVILVSGLSTACLVSLIVLVVIFSVKNNNIIKPSSTFDENNSRTQSSCILPDRFHLPEEYMERIQRNPQEIYRLPNPIVNSDFRLSGFRNLYSDRCFMNSVIQSMMACECIRNFYLNEHYSTDIIHGDDVYEDFNKNANKALYHLFWDQFGVYYGDRQKVDSLDIEKFNTLLFNNELLSGDGKRMKTGQHDASEFIVFLLRNIHPRINIFFEGEKTEIRPEPQCCNHRRFDFDTIKCINSLANVVNVLLREDLLQSRTNFDLLESLNRETSGVRDTFQCDVCQTQSYNHHVRRLRRNTNQQKIMCIALTRFQKMNRGQYSKDTTPMKQVYQKIYALDIRHDPDQLQFNNKKTLYERQPNCFNEARINDFDPQLYQLTEYQLKAMVLHTGNMSGGHYRAVVRYGQNNWYLCDDSRVTKISSLDNADYSRDILKNVYMIFYEKVQDDQLIFDQGDY